MIRQTPTASLSELAQRLSVSKKTVRDVRDRTSWDHI
jgi:DeoR/GlpR family transcriptional regulator of sugar metabolism